MKVTEKCVIGFVSQFSPASLSRNFGLLSEAAQPTIELGHCETFTRHN
jgi:hypothetical protein